MRGPPAGGWACGAAHRGSAVLRLERDLKHLQESAIYGVTPEQFCRGGVLNDV